MATSKIIGGLNPLLQWLNELLNLFQTETIKVPTDYRQQVLKVKAMLEDDPSGLTNTILDFAINCALVNYKIETDNPNLTKILNDWLDRINEDLLGKIPTGLEALAKEYFRERWKGSSNILLRTFWSSQNGLMLPTSLFLVDGEDIKVNRKSKDGVVRLGDEVYYIRVGDNSQLDITDSTFQPVKPNDIKLPSSKDEVLFAQKPFESWGVSYPVPFLIRRGVYRSSEFLRLMYSKGEFILGRALEYLLIMKKGTERMALEGQVTYDEEDLKKANEDLKNIINQKKSEGGVPSYATNFDTEFTDYIPDYQKAISATLYSPHEKKVLAGLGMIEIVEGIASTRREAILNPKPFIAEVEQGVSDFKSLLKDIIKVFIQKNQAEHKKWASAEIKIINSPIKAFIDDKTKTLLRSLYDRGVLSKRTAVEVAGNLDFNLEVSRRIDETKQKLDEVMYPPIILNQEAQEYTNVNKKQTPIDKTKNVDDKKTPDKVSVEKKNFTQSKLQDLVVCKKCNHEGTVEEFVDNPDNLEESAIQCPTCGEYLEPEADLEISSFPLITASIEEQPKETATLLDLVNMEFSGEEFQISAKEFEQAPYNKNTDLPKTLHVLPGPAKTLWRKTFNSILADSKDEDKARKIAWYQVKQKFEKRGDKWTRKSQGQINLEDLSVSELTELKKLEILEKQEKLLDKLNNEDSVDEAL